MHALGKDDAAVAADIRTLTDVRNLRKQLEGGAEAKAAKELKEAEEALAKIEDRFDFRVLYGSEQGLLESRESARNRLYLAQAHATELRDARIRLDTLSKDFAAVIE